MKTFDAIVIGSGQGGVPLATNFAKLGWRVALIEEGQLGGSCINYGCTPTKTMIASARIAQCGETRPAIRRACRQGQNRHGGNRRAQERDLGVIPLGN